MANRAESPFYKEIAQQKPATGKTSLSQLLIIGTLTILIFIIPWIFTTNTEEFYEIAKNYLLLVGVSVLVMVWSITTIIKKKVILYKTPIDLAIMGGLISMILATIFSVNTDASIWGYHMRMTGGLISYVILIAIYYLVINNIHSKETVKFLLKAIVYSITLVALFTLLKGWHVFDDLLINLVNAHPNLDFLRSPLFTPTGNPNSLTFIFVTALPLSLFLFINKKRPSAKDTIIGLLSSAVLLLACTLTSITSGIDWTRLITWILIAGIVLIAFIYNARIPAKNSGRMAVYIIMILLAVFGFFYANDSGFRNKLGSNPDFSRYYDIPSATSWQILTGTYNKYSFKSFLVGTGPDTYAYMFPQFRPLEQNLQPNWMDNYTRSNTQIEAVLVNSGILGFASYALLVFFILKFLFQKIFKTTIISKKRSLFSMALVVIVFLVSFFLTYHSITLLFFSWIIIALMFKLYTIMYPKEEAWREIDLKIIDTNYPEKPRNLAQYVFSATGILAAMAVIFYVTINFKAESYYNSGQQLVTDNNYDAAYDNFVAAVNLNNGRDYYHREIASVALNKLGVIVQAAQNVSNKTTTDQLQQNANTEQYLLSLINDEINKTLALDPEDHENWQQAALIYKGLTELAQGQQFGSEMLQAVQKAISLNPNNPDNFLMLGYIYQYNSDAKLKALAEQAYLKAYDLQPSYVYSIIQLGSYLESVPKYQDALNLYTVSLEQFFATDSSMNKFLKSRISLMNQLISAKVQTDNTVIPLITPTPASDKPAGNQ